MEMQQAEAAQTVRQVINWYLLWAARGKHSPTGEPKCASTLRVQRSIAENYLDCSFLDQVFVDVVPQDMQDQIDGVAGGGAETASLGLKGLFEDVDRFALRHSVIDRLRIHKLLGPKNPREPKALDDKEFKQVWEDYRYCAQGGSIQSRGPCLAILLSAVTLQSPRRVIGMRREEVDFNSRMWAHSSDGEASSRIHLSPLAVDFIQKAFTLGDLIHRGPPSPFVFPSAGPKRDPLRAIGFSMLYEVTRELFKNRDIRPSDLRQTGVVKLKGMGGETFHAVVDQIANGRAGPPSPEEVVILDAWANQISVMSSSTPGR
jgi:hypothetical protein